jgi:ribosomal protein S18 acetylase RimI-like enzyme
VIGFLIGDHSYGGVCFISWFGILKEYRKQGLGSMLLKKYIEYALSRRAHLIELYTYNGASGFYEKHGFQLIGKREQGFFGQKNLIMNIKLKDFDVNDVL